MHEFTAFVFHVAPIRGFVFVGCCSHGLSRGYNISSLRDYCRLKALLRTRRMRNVMLDANGNF